MQGAGNHVLKVDTEYVKGQRFIFLGFGDAGTDGRRSCTAGAAAGPNTLSHARANGVPPLYRA